MNGLGGLFLASYKMGEGYREDGNLEKASLMLSGTVGI